MIKQNQNITRLVVNFFVTVFVIVVILTVLLLLLYYFTPNNYILELYDKSKHNLIKEYIVNIKPNSSVIVPIDDSNKYMIRFLILKNKAEEPIKLEELIKSEDNSKFINENEINILIKNIFKSQSIIISSNYVVKTKYDSKIIILNTLECPINIKILLFN
jgi:hypothetical protein